MAATMAACSNPQAAGDRLLRELPSAYPSQITGIGFENNPPMDPPTLFIDLAPTTDPTAQLRFLCDEVMPRVNVASSRIAVTVSYGWSDEDCR